MAEVLDWEFEADGERDDGLMTGQEVAALYGLSPGAFRVWAHRRNLKPVTYDTHREALYNLNQVHELRGYPPQMARVEARLDELRRAM